MELRIRSINRGATYSEDKRISGKDARVHVRAARTAARKLANTKCFKSHQKGHIVEGRYIVEKMKMDGDIII